MKENRVSFISIKTKEKYSKLQKGKYEDKKIKKEIDYIVKELRNNEEVGIKIPKKLWPKDYIVKYKLNNLNKINLRNGWRLIYTIKEIEAFKLCLIIDWYDHKNYERMFKY